MGSLVNTITSPLGIKLFSGGPYSDRQLGDQSLAAAKPLQTAGTNLLNTSQGNAPAGSPYASLFNDIGKESGVNTPFGGTAGTTATPGELSGGYLDMYNNLKGHTEKARGNALSQLKSHLSARGLGDSSEARAHEAYLNSQFDNHLADTMSTLQGQQHQERLQTLNNFIASLQGLGNQGANMISGNVANLNTNANAATQRTNQGINNAVGFASNFTPGGAFGNVFGGGSGGGGGSYSGLPYGPPASAGYYNNPQQWDSFYNPFGAY